MGVGLDDLDSSLWVVTVYEEVWADGWVVGNAEAVFGFVYYDDDLDACELG